MAPPIRGNLEALLAGSPHPEQLNALVRCCHGIAKVCISGKRTSGTLLAIHGLNYNDLAYDCIADLFQRDERGNYVMLQSYFAGLSTDTLTEEEVLIHLRRLVSSRVNQNIFRLYSEADPPFAKILRNVKLAIHSLQNFTESERFGEPCISPSLCDSLEHLPPYEFEKLLGELLISANGDERIPDLLGMLSLVLREQHEHSRIVPLINVARLFRSVYEKKRSRNEDEGEDSIPGFEQETVQVALDHALKLVHARYVQRQGGGNEESQSESDKYFVAIQHLFMSRLVRQDGYGSSLFKSLSALLPEMTVEEFRKKHRSRIEYLARLVQKETLAELRK